jgi:hypothetical protein
LLPCGFGEAMGVIGAREVDRLRAQY